MLQLNLLPQEFYIRKKERLRKNFIIAGIFGAISSILLFSLGIYYYNFNLDNIIARIDKRLNELKPVVENLKKVETERDILKKKVLLIEELLKGQALWPRVLDDLNMTISDGVYFASFYNDAGGIYIDGRVVSTSQRGAEENLVQYISRVKSSGVFEDVNFSFRKIKEELQTVELAFLLRCRLKTY
ncbi:MAG: hypothetical protein AB1765_05095 [Candidatus Hydrogenedentota bacterium]